VAQIEHDPEVAALIEQLATLVRQDVQDATGLPAALYTSPAFHQAEQAALFQEGWLCIGREAALPAAGDYRVTDIGPLSVITLRGRDGQLRSFANSCLHRMTRLLEGRGNCRGRITCPYHAWTYRDDGRLVGAPYMDGVAGSISRRWRSGRCAPRPGKALSSSP
jgi:phenylpropionate dioxygenase-like ring-hydroxylating dioxygenase large terminal subunit